MAHICMLVTSELDRDPRVQKEARIAYEAGYQVTVLCRSYDGHSMPYVVKPLGIGRKTSLLAKYVERLRTNIRLLQLTISCKPNIIHANDLDTLPAAYFAAKLCRAALIYDAHELWSDMGGSRAGRLGKVLGLYIERFLSKKADSIVTVSRYRGEAMVAALGIDPPTVVMNTPYYVSPEKLKARDWIARIGESRIVLYQGRYADGMGLAEAILAAKHLPDDVILVFRGYGPFEDEMRKTISANDLQQRVRLVPPVPMNDLVFTAVGADLGLVVYNPVNLNNVYAAPNKLFEFIMAGVPCVGSDLPYIREILVGYELGTVFVPGNSADMAWAIMDLLDDPSMLANMKKNCLEIAHEFSWEVEGSKLLKEYARISNE